MDRESITGLPRRPADHRVTLRQIGVGARMNLGARDFLHDDPRGELRFRVGRSRRAIVILTPDDLYAVEIGRLHRRTREWIPEANATRLFADQLADTLIRLHHEAAYG